MAVKERKQITGTTAQIQAYKGHEGQIVWDKEKKTFVGMSGTAGKNYPLAPQAYVDNEVSKVNAEVAKKQPKGDYATNAQLTQGLAGKEDKGTCLPLTGGVLSGELRLDPSFADGNINIGFSFADKIGGGIGLRSINYAKAPGAFSLYAQDSTKFTALEGLPDGTLTWGGRPISYITDSGTNPSSGHYVRFADGIQICAWQTSSSSPTTVISYPVPFAYLFTTVVDHATASSTQWNATAITITSNGGGALGYFSYLAIGRWK